MDGTVDQGVEPGCLVLGQYLLIGGSQDLLKPGASVSVTGTVATGMATTCQQGTPLQVEKVEPRK